MIHIVDTIHKIEVPMACRKVEKMIPLYLDGELSTETKVSVRAHIQHCTKCHDFKKDVKRVIALRGKLDRIRVPAGLTEKIQRTLENSQNKRRK